MTASSINRAGIASGGIAAVAETARTVSDIKAARRVWATGWCPFLLIAVVALCGYLVWEGIKVRREGRS